MMYFRANRQIENMNIIGLLRNIATLFPKKSIRVSDIVYEAVLLNALFLLQFGGLKSFAIAHSNIMRPKKGA